MPVFAGAVVSPEIHADGSVTFRLAAPEARRVLVQREGFKDSTMSQDGQGIWTFTTRPLEPDIYTYAFVVDGLRVTDPSNAFLKYSLLSNESMVEVDGTNAMPWQIQAVPHGRLHRHFYRSAVCGDDRDFIVYTPPGYDPVLHKYYPVLYLLHGYSDDATAWTGAGRVNVILDNLIARGQAKPMLVVMPLGYGTMDIVKGGWDRVHDPDLARRNLEKFSESVLAEVMPQVEEQYRVKSGSPHHAIAGLSMGGAEALFIGLNHPEKFAWIGAFSSGGLEATNFPVRYPQLTADVNKKLKLLWISCGREDDKVAGSRQFCEWLAAKDIRYAWVETPGGHSYRVWRRNAAQFLPLLFQAGK
jgi:enterochelin esterase family protein